MAHPEDPKELSDWLKTAQICGFGACEIAAMAHVADCKTVAEVIAHEVKVVTGWPPDQEGLDDIPPTSLDAAA